jgi:hypothetical protein
MRLRAQSALAALVVAFQLVPPAPAQGETAADSMARKIDDLRERYLKGASSEKDFRLSEVEVNAYLAERVVEQLPQGVEGLWVRFTRGRLRGGGRVDLASLRDRVPGALALLLSGVVPVELTATLQAEGGTGRVDVQRVLLAGVEVPRTLLQQIVTHYSRTASRPGGVRLEDPFDLPYGVKSARIHDGEILIRQGPVELTPGSR